MPKRQKKKRDKKNKSEQSTSKRLKRNNTIQNQEQDEFQFKIVLFSENKKLAKSFFRKLHNNVDSIENESLDLFLINVPFYYNKIKQDFNDSINSSNTIKLFFYVITDLSFSKYGYDFVNHLIQDSNAFIGLFDGKSTKHWNFLIKLYRLKEKNQNLNKRFIPTLKFIVNLKPFIDPEIFTKINHSNHSHYLAQNNNHKYIDKLNTHSRNYSNKIQYPFYWNQLQNIREKYNLIYYQVNFDDMVSTKLFLKELTDSLLNILESSIIENITINWKNFLFENHGRKPELIDLNFVEKKIKEGKTIKEIAKKLSVSRETLRIAMRNFGFPPLIEKHDFSIEKYKEYRKSGYKNKEIAKFFGISEARLYQILKKRKLSNSTRGKKIIISEKRIMSLLERNLTKKQIAEKLNISYSTLYRILKRIDQIQ